MARARPVPGTQGRLGPADTPGVMPKPAPHPTFRRLTTAALLAGLWGLAGCDQLGIATPAVEAARREAEGKAIGGGCRHAARSVETCYDLNKRADKAAVFAGWREMNDYMRENKIDAMPAPPPVAMAEEEEPGPAAAKGKAKR